MKNRVCLILVFLSLLYTSVRADSTSFKPKRFWFVMGSTVTAYSGAMVGLSQLWYKDQPKSAFHFFNDNHEWNQIDKLGHGTTAFHESRAGIRMLEWTGMSHKKAIWYGSLTGFIFQTPIEIFDGYSAEYGASVGDLIANTGGSVLVLGQYLIWDQVHVQMKYSYRSSPYASLRPNILGSNGIQRMLKDYNGQTYWLSANLKGILFPNRKFIPWLNVAFGYGADGMVYAEERKNNANGYYSYRQFYISLDVDTEKIKTNRKGVKAVLFALNMFKVPFPSLTFDTKGRVQVLPLY